MLKSELIKQITLHSKKLEATQVADGVNLILQEISEYLKANKRVEIRGFGTFTSRYQKARVSINPKRQELFDLPERYLPHFKVGKTLREALIKSIE